MLVVYIVLPFIGAAMIGVVAIYLIKWRIAHNRLMNARNLKNFDSESLKFTNNTTSTQKLDRTYLNINHSDVSMLDMSSNMGLRPTNKIMPEDYGRIDTK